MDELNDLQRGAFEVDQDADAAQDVELDFDADSAFESSIITEVESDEDLDQDIDSNVSGADDFDLNAEQSAIVEDNIDVDVEVVGSRPVVVNLDVRCRAGPPISSRMWTFGHDDGDAGAGRALGAQPSEPIRKSTSPRGLWVDVDVEEDDGVIVADVKVRFDSAIEIDERPGHRRGGGGDYGAVYRRRRLRRQSSSDDVEVDIDVDADLGVDVDVDTRHAFCARAQLALTEIDGDAGGWEVDAIAAGQRRRGRRGRDHDRVPATCRTSDRTARRKQCRERAPGSR